MKRLALGALLAAVLAQSAAAQTQQVQNPQWLQQPNAADFVQNYPPHAAMQAVEGFATIECAVRLDTTLNCALTNESPASWGFGDAALAVARTFRMEPARVDGVPTDGGRIRQTIRFVLPEDAPADLTAEDRAYIEAQPPPDLPTWDDAPTPSMVLAATPARMRAAQTAGRGVLSCRVAETRRLNCEPLYETPARSGLAAAAMTLVPHFRVVQSDTEFITRHATEPFVLPISFGSVREITPVNRAFAGGSVFILPPHTAPQEVIPEAAREARVNGTVVALCTLRPEPPLDCVLESETPTEWGFAALVMEMLKYFPRPPAQAGIIPGDQIRFTIEFRPD